MKNKYFEEYNSRENILVISSYPRKKEKYSRGVCAVASFAKNTLLQIQAQNHNRKIIVLTMKLGEKEEIYKEDGMLIIRCFERNNPFSYLSLLKQLFKFNQVKDVLMEFEFSSFGNLIATSSLSLVVWLMFILRKNINLVVHQVILDLNELSGHVGIAKNSLKIKIFNLCLCYFYKFLIFPATKVVVLEDELKSRLEKIINQEKIIVIPHGVDTSINSRINVKTAREKLGFEENDFVVLYFGYLTWYKGVDLLVKTLQKYSKINRKNLKVVIAGGPSFTQGEKVHYQKFLKKTLDLAKITKHIHITGFIPEEKIPLYFKAANLNILPYRKFMSSSGPFSLALSFGKPVIVSKNLSALLKSEDVKQALSEAGLTADSLIFNLNGKSLINKLIQAQKPSLEEKLIKFSQSLAEKRSFNRIAFSYLSLLNQATYQIYNKKLIIPAKISS